MRRLTLLLTALTTILLCSAQSLKIKRAEFEQWKNSSLKSEKFGSLPYRIARINDLMWSELFVANKDVLLDQMDRFIDRFNDLKAMLEAEDIDGMRDMMRHSTERRALFDKK